jgi:adenylate cyclase
MRRARLLHSLLVPPAVTLLCALLALSGIVSAAGGRLHDFLLLLKPGPVPAPEILMVDVDEQAATAAGPWPWTRDVLAEGLVVLKEMDAAYAVLDLPLGQKSAPVLDPSSLRRALPDALEREFAQMEENIQSLFDAIRRGSVRPQDSPRYVSDLIGLVALAKIRLLGAATGIERDDDVILGRAGDFFGRTFVPLELLPGVDSAVDNELMGQTLKRLSLAVLVPGADPSMRASGIRPPVLPVLRAAHGGGFTGLLPDSDGVRRRATLTAEYAGAHFGQIAFSALLDLLGDPAVELGARRVVLHIAARPGAEARTLTIPLTDSGQALIDWPKAAVGDGFRHLSWAELIRYGRLEDDLLGSLKDMDARGYLSYLRSDTGLLDAYDAAARLKEEMLRAGESANAGVWRSARARFFSLADQFLNGDAEARIIADADRTLGSEALSEAEKLGLRRDRDKVPGDFSHARLVFAELEQERSTLQGSLRGAFCIVSLAISMTPPSAGRTPFGAVVTDASASAALVSTILSGRFPREVPLRYSLILAALLSVLATAAVYRMRPFAALLCGLGLACAGFAFLSALFVLFGDFMDPIFPAGSAALTCAVLAILAISRSRREARALRGAFSGRLSAESLDTLLASPERRAPAGEKRDVTVLSATVKGLPAVATLSEPRELVHLLTTYHAGVREAIFSLEGMVGRAGGDAFAVYFGAPLVSSDHARRACLAALRVKAVEKELNIVASPPLATRIGIDTGECIVGELGAAGAPGYSVVGATTDLAARLEALNARFGTSILISEAVRDAAGADFLLRSLDRVRFAGTDARFRAYELIAEKGVADDTTIESIEIFNEGLARFEQKEWHEAGALFARVLALRPGDGPAALYSERCREHESNPSPPATSDPY